MTYKMENMPFPLSLENCIICSIAVLGYKSYTWAMIDYLYLTSFKWE